MNYIVLVRRKANQIQAHISVESATQSYIKLTNITLDNVIG